MAGLSVLLEEEDSGKKPHIVTKVGILSPRPPPPVAGTPITSSPFLMNCYLCREKLLEGNDIFMYSSNAFCTEECRAKQMAEDEGRKKHRSSSGSAEKASPPPRQWVPGRARQ